MPTAVICGRMQERCDYMFMVYWRQFFSMFRLPHDKKTTWLAICIHSAFLSFFLLVRSVELVGKAIPWNKKTRWRNAFIISVTSTKARTVFGRWMGGWVRVRVSERPLLPSRCRDANQKPLLYTQPSNKRDPPKKKEKERKVDDTKMEEEKE